MADRGPLPTELQIKKTQVEIRRLEHQIEFQEMEQMELRNSIDLKQENIDASKLELEKNKVLLAEHEKRLTQIGPGKE